MRAAITDWVRIILLIRIMFISIPRCGRVISVCFMGDWALVARHAGLVASPRPVNMGSARRDGWFPPLPMCLWKATAYVPQYSQEAIW